jgi:cyclopropane fatty-acyl-phospholipid synthase-like methyltransferase
MNHRPQSAAAERNRIPIADVLEAWLADRGSMLEIGAGTGQHADYMSRRLPGWRWLPTEHPAQFQILLQGLSGVETQGLRAPLKLDVQDHWPEERFDAVYSANTAHIMHWAAVESMFAGVARCLVPRGRFFLYGPFSRDGRHHAASNADFDRSLKARDPGMGVRDLDDIDALAARVGLARVAELLLPANNHMLILEPTEQKS